MDTWLCHGRHCWKDWTQRSGLWFVRPWTILDSYRFFIRICWCLYCKCISLFSFFFFMSDIPATEWQPVCLVDRCTMPCLTWKKKHQPTIVLHCTTVKLYHEEKRCSCEGCVECSKNFFHRLIYGSFFALFFETNVAGNTTLDVMGNRDTVVALVIKSVKNPRSALCKTALMTSTDMFMAYQDQLLDLLDPLVWTWDLVLFRVMLNLPCKLLKDSIGY